ncbi:MAG: M23 family metallopeptidase [Candidatus Buchananbacteria bacterium]
METKNNYGLPIDLAKVSKIEHESESHEGDLKYSIDYDASEGTLIYASFSGVIIKVKDDSNVGGLDKKFEDSGNFIEILHANNEVSEYEHIKFKSSRVRVGETVKEGEIIAEVGNTGWSECPHLHFMVYQSGNEYKTLKIKFK